MKEEGHYVATLLLELLLVSLTKFLLEQARRQQHHSKFRLGSFKVSNPNNSYSNCIKLQNEWLLEITCARKFPSAQVYPPISNLAQFCLKPMFSYVVSCHYCPLSFNSLVSAGCGPSRAVSNCQLLRVRTELKKQQT